MKIAVTGACGTIGKRLCADLAADHELVRIDRDPAADVVIDIEDLAGLEAAFAGCETVVHLAGNVDVVLSWEQTAGTNLHGTYCVFEAAKRAGCTRVIFASSNHAVGMYEVEAKPAIYERGAGVVVRTDAPVRPDGLYGVWKVFGEALGRYYSDNFGLQVTCVRIGTITVADDPRHDSVRTSSGWLDLNDEQKFARLAATWLSQRDFAALVRAIVAKDVPFAVVYGVGDNATRFWDLEPGRAIFGWWPRDGSK